MSMSSKHQQELSTSKELSIGNVYLLIVIITMPLMVWEHFFQKRNMVKW